MRQLGAARASWQGRDFDAAKDAARACVAAAPRRHVHRGRARARHRPRARGRIAVELDRWPEPLDAVLVPLGNGSLLAGMGTWLRAHRPGHAHHRRVRGAGAGHGDVDGGGPSPVVTQTADTIADGIAVRVPVPEALDDLRGVVDDVLLVEEAAIVDAMRLVFDTLGVVVEPAGVVGIAAAVVHRARLPGCTWRRPCAAAT